MERSPNISWIFHFRVLCEYLVKKYFFFKNHFLSLHCETGEYHLGTVMTVAIKLPL